MIDLEGKDLEVGIIYIVPGSSNHMIVAKYSHDTEASSIFKQVKYNKLTPAGLYSWKRVVCKYNSQRGLPVIRASQELIDRYELC